ncbi:hypothetical protein EVAR_24953_1 [Eumeta japonica]|uniref:Uncharacterized protein n=1 Tax=Eumeta variegata TaxID=151549 RepID=A0A4C1ZZ37_EUMVA|nr:hypothetical protein EVAR_24953_1 [Eumeta japonica]
MVTADYGHSPPGGITSALMEDGEEERELATGILIYWTKRELGSCHLKYHTLLSTIDKKRLTDAEIHVSAMAIKSLQRLELPVREPSYLLFYIASAKLPVELKAWFKQKYGSDPRVLPTIERVFDRGVSRREMSAPRQQSTAFVKQLGMWYTYLGRHFTREYDRVQLGASSATGICTTVSLHPASLLLLVNPYEEQLPSERYKRESVGSRSFDIDPRLLRTIYGQRLHISTSSEGVDAGGHIMPSALIVLRISAASARGFACVDFEHIPLSCVSTVYDLNPNPDFDTDLFHF